MSLDDVPVIGNVLVTVGALADVFLQGGEFVFGLLAFALTNVGMLLPLLRYSETLATLVPFVDAATFGLLRNSAIGALLLLNGARIVTSYQQR